MVGGFDRPANDILQFPCRAMHAATNLLFGQRRGPAFDQIEPGSAGGSAGRFPRGAAAKQKRARCGSPRSNSGSRHRTRGPVRGIGRVFLQCQSQNTLHVPIAYFSRRSGGAVHPAGRPGVAAQSGCATCRLPAYSVAFRRSFGCWSYQRHRPE